MMTSSPPPAQLVHCEPLDTPMTTHVVTSNQFNQLQHHTSVKSQTDGGSQCARFKRFCFTQLNRLFTDFWSKESKLTVLSELLLQQNLVVLAILREHIKHLINRIERTPNAEVLVPLFKTAAAGDIALSKAHLSHVKLLFYYVSLAHKKCAHVCNITSHRGKQSEPPARMAYPCLPSR